MDRSRALGPSARHLTHPRAARVARLLVDRFWAPVGNGVQPEKETRFLTDYLFAGSDGRAAARRIDGRIRRLPGFGDVRLLERWMNQAVGPPPLCAVSTTLESTPA